MKRKWMIVTSSVCLATMLLGQGMTALADAGGSDSVSTLKEIRSHGKLDLISGDSSIQIDSGDLQLLQSELDKLFAEINYVPE